MVGCKAIWNPCHEVVGNEAVECDDGGIREGAADLCLRGLDAAAGEREEAGEEGVDDLLGSAASAHVGRGAGRRGGQRRGVGYPSGRGGGEVVGGARCSHRGGDADKLVGGSHRPPLRLLPAVAFVSDYNR